MGKTAEKRKPRYPAEPSRARLTMAGSPAGRACVIGMVVTAAIGASLLFISLYSGEGFGSKTREIDFQRRLEEFDRQAEIASAPETLNKLLEDLEKNALGAESYLSILKRRRNLAMSGEEVYVETYRSGAERSAEKFPQAEELAAVAAEALIWEARTNNGFPLLGEDAERLIRYAGVLREGEFQSLALGAYVLAGAYRDPESALEIPEAEDFLVHLEAQGYHPDSMESYLLDGAILRLLRGERDLDLVQGLEYWESGAAGSGETTSALREDPVIRRATLFGAEVLYDFGDPMKAASLFARFSDEASMARRADALYLAGREELARNLWTILVSPDMEGRFPSDQNILIRSLYNLGSVSQDKSSLERLISLNSEHLFGIIAYSRMLEADEALTFFEKIQDPQPLVKLEELRRNRENWRIDRVIPETWLLLNRHPREAPLYQWANYYFELQRQSEEIRHLIRSAEVNGVQGTWIPVSQALHLIREGRLDEGEKLLREIPQQGPWRLQANLGRILEAKQQNSAALEHYENAAGLVTDDREAAKIQVRMAYCLRALGRRRDSRQALENARRLDGDNLAIRLELRRMESAEGR